MTDKELNREREEAAEPDATRDTDEALKPAVDEKAREQLTDEEKGADADDK